MVVTNLDNDERGCGYVSQEVPFAQGLADTRTPNLTAFVAKLANQVNMQEMDETHLDCEAECPLLAMRVESVCGKPLMPYTCESFCEGREHSPHLPIETIADAVSVMAVCAWPNAS